MGGVLVFLPHILILFFGISILEDTGYMARIAFIMELPPYRVPTLRSTLIHMWEKAKHYLQKMGGVVLIFSIIIWFLGNYPSRPELEEHYKGEIETLLSTENYEQEELVTLARELQKEKVKQSYIGQAGTFIEPALQPLGFDWRMGVSLLTGFVAKEVVVSTLGVLFTVNEEAEETSSELRAALQRNYSALAGFAFLVFVMLYTPCIVAFITLIREIGSWQWSLFSLFYQVTLAWIAAFLVYQAGMLLGLG